MALATLFAAATILAAAQAEPAPDDAFAQARAGRLLCSAPNVARRTCESLSRFTWSKDGRVRQTSETLLAQDPVLSFKSSSTGMMRSGAYCGTVGSEDVDDAVFIVDGRPAPRRVAEQLHELLSSALADFVGREVCLSFMPSGSGFRSVVTVNGLNYTHLSETVIWVRPNEGYAVKP